MKVTGEYMHPVIAADHTNDDPWQRNYNQPPPFRQLVPRSYPLTDIRLILSEPGHGPADLLTSHGFGIARHHSAFMDKLPGPLAEQDFNDIYIPEIEQLIRDTTGAKYVYIIGGLLRQGKPAPESYQMPTKVGEAKDAIANTIGTDSNDQPHRLASQHDLKLSKPIRNLHMDFTPLGARQMIRHHDQRLLDAATKSGVIAHEDEIAREVQAEATSKEANDVINQKYNQNGLGPRYAAYSIWRPLKQVQRDPITLVPRKEQPHAPGELVHWPYLNKAKGPAELGGDYLKEFAMLGVRTPEPPAGTADDDAGESIQCFYISKQEPEEVLFIKQFDSASLGPDAREAAAPWHGSPEIGFAEGEEARESVEVRAIAFW